MTERNKKVFKKFELVKQCDGKGYPVKSTWIIEGDIAYHIIKGVKFIVDKDLFNVVNKFKWMLAKKSINANELILHTCFYGCNLQYLVLPKRDDKIIDHINSIKTDNRKCNLRYADYQQNKANSSLQKNNKVGYKGVHYFVRDNIFCSKITVNNHSIFLGRFTTAEEAALVYDQAAIKYFGEYAKTNHMMGLI